VENALLIGLSRQMALQREVDIVANNIANLNTTGFKADGHLFAEYLMPGARSDAFAGADRRMSFVLDRATWHDLGQGPIQQTGNPLDVAIDGKAYLTVDTPRGERYTRNGALQINAQGELVTTEGHRVAGDNGPIVFQPGDRDITINREGVISVRQGTNAADQQRGRLRLVGFAQPERLRKDGTTLFDAPAGMTPQPAPTAGVIQGAVEKSNVRAVVEMTRMVEVSRTYTAVANLIQAHGDLRRTALERLADVPS
jgi:flagellar basal-body rod protein FlgF